MYKYIRSKEKSYQASLRYNSQDYLNMNFVSSNDEYKILLPTELRILSNKISDNYVDTITTESNKHILLENPFYDQEDWEFNFSNNSLTRKDQSGNNLQPDKDNSGNAIPAIVVQKNDVSGTLVLKNYRINSISPQELLIKQMNLFKLSIKTSKDLVIKDSAAPGTTPEYRKLKSYIKTMKYTCD